MFFNIRHADSGHRARLAAKRTALAKGVSTRTNVCCCTQIIPATLLVIRVRDVTYRHVQYCLVMASSAVNGTKPGAHTASASELITRQDCGGGGHGSAPRQDSNSARLARKYGQDYSNHSDQKQDKGRG